MLLPVCDAGIPMPDSGEWADGGTVSRIVWPWVQQSRGRCGDSAYQRVGGVKFDICRFLRNQFAYAAYKRHMSWPSSG